MGGCSDNRGYWLFVCSMDVKWYSKCSRTKSANVAGQNLQMQLKQALTNCTNMKERPERLGIRFQTTLLNMAYNYTYSAPGHGCLAAWLLQVLSLRFLDISQPEITPTWEIVVDPAVCSERLSL